MALRSSWRGLINRCTARGCIGGRAGRPKRWRRQCGIPKRCTSSARAFSAADTGSPGAECEPAAHDNVFYVWGANTNVGKTVLSYAVMQAADRALFNTARLFVKPVQTGPVSEHDAPRVNGKIAPSHPDQKNNARQTICVRTLFQFENPVSPDLAAEHESRHVGDEHIIRATHNVVENWVKDCIGNKTNPFVLIEGAGGPLSPTPSGSLQADVYRHIPFPVVLVADNRLGGISSTLAAHESIRLRGFDVPFVVIFESDAGLANDGALRRHLRDSHSCVFVMPPLPKPDDSLHDWYSNHSRVHEAANELVLAMDRWNLQRHETLARAPLRAQRDLWWPFTQHRLVSSDAVTVIDSAFHNDVLTFRREERTGKGAFVPMFDAVGAWWTNGLGHGDVGLAKSIAAAAGRYGHILFPQVAHAPALELADLLLNGSGKHWASRVFFSDDGSTGIEVSLKMAFRLRSKRLGLEESPEYKIIGLQDSYHGDTLGAMNCSPSSVFNSQQTPWYTESGIFFKCPTVQMRNGEWTVEYVPAESSAGLKHHALFTSLEDILDLKGREGSELNAKYSAAIEFVLQQNRPESLGALLIEPVLQGAGGMKLIDPLFQRQLVDSCRARGIPIVFDEVFSGLWRLGCESGAILLQTHPDIATYSKLLTGGTVPLAATLASEQVFESFAGDLKAQALLHGHSYSGHVIGCAAAVHSLQQYEKMPTFDAHKRCFGAFWDEAVVRDISVSPGVRGVVAIGTVLAVELEPDSSSTGYTAKSESVQRILDHLRAHGVFSRPLGNVVYVMCAPATERAEAEVLARKVQAAVHSLSLP
ncbi:Bifunctional dethiobiotin synthetase/7,8-diamino-pelargonic acid aminotransferase, mitochondrial [Porphyridium purpureum]|uniref:Bifunctional dethiobiotin synthetase/7,8-diamino-pelargonic acid aminotransferase, mitochondrial n=1 Tax=Porphyridium purpureum TaxID=35688 RepID=A0A5J4ZB19_PORPP|nr:Bifunctional dethiobiotin synthetase/7,8-diamino-pelargonic acid aminotransferase, mitochondrial [Porphyridium purpureum]|eukprot:POR5565..scf295_1